MKATEAKDLATAFQILPRNLLKLKLNLAYINKLMRFF